MSDTAVVPSTEPILLYAPGLGTYQANTAVGVAEVLAAILSRRSSGDYRAAALPTVSAPRGLRLGKTVLDPSGAPVLQVFELDYRAKMEPQSGPSGPAAQPGAVRATTSLLRASLMLLGALRRPAKGWKAKLQLAYALTLVGALAFAAIAAVVAALLAAGIGGWIPKNVRGTFGAVAASAGAASVGVWAVVRRRLLSVAAAVQRNMRYMDEGRHRDTVALTLDDAIDGLRDSGWIGPVHVLGYSFGSLVAIDALFPPTNSAFVNPRVTEAVASLTTIGCPVDFVRLLRPSYFDGRTARAPGLRWSNVFIPADVLASNMRDGGDGLDVGTAWAIAGVTPETRQYGDDQLELTRILAAKGFRTHGGYWGGPDEASCFDPLLDRWLSPSTAAPVLAPSTASTTATIVTTTPPALATPKNPTTSATAT